MKRFLLPVAALLLAGAALTGCDDKKEDKPAPAVPAVPSAPPPVAIPVH